jgi:hypothetical protein
MFWKMVRDSIGGLGLVCLLVVMVPTLGGCRYVNGCQNGRGHEGNSEIYLCVNLPDGGCLYKDVRCDVDVPECYCREIEHYQSGELICPCSLHGYKDPEDPEV